MDTETVCMHTCVEDAHIRHTYFRTHGTPASDKPAACPAEDMLAELQLLKKYKFIGGSSRGIFIDFTAYFPGDAKFATVSILFEIGAADVVVFPR